MKPKSNDGINNDEGLKRQLKNNQQSSFVSSDSNYLSINSFFPLNIIDYLKRTFPVAGVGRVPKELIRGGKGGILSLYLGLKNLNQNTNNYFGMGTDIKDNDISVGPGTTSKNMPQDNKTGVVYGPSSRSPYYNYNFENRPKFAEDISVLRNKLNLIVDDDVQSVSYGTIEFIKNTIASLTKFFKNYYLLSCTNFMISPFLLKYNESLKNNIIYVCKIYSEDRQFPLYFIASNSEIDVDDYREKANKIFNKKLGILKTKKGTKLIGININKSYELDIFSDILDFDISKIESDNLVWFGRIEDKFIDKIYELPRTQTKRISDSLYFLSTSPISNNYLKLYLSTLGYMFLENKKFLTGYEFLITNSILNYNNLFDNLNFLIDENARNYNRLEKIVFCLDKENMKINALNIIMNRRLRDIDNKEGILILVTTDEFRSTCSQEEQKTIFRNRKLIFKEDNIKVYSTDKL